MIGSLDMLASLFKMFASLEAKATMMLRCCLRVDASAGQRRASQPCGLLTLCGDVAAQARRAKEMWWWGERDRGIEL